MESNVEGIGETWREFFHHWPAEVPAVGVLVANWDEQIPFDGFMVSQQLLLLDRRTPDTLGARKILMPFTQIAGVKLTEVVDRKSFQGVGFVPGGGKKGVAAGHR